MMLRTVVISGAAALLPGGDWQLASGRPLPPASEVAGAMADFSLGRYLEAPKTYLDRASALALAGTAEALRDAGLEWPLLGRGAGIVLGTHLGCLETMKVFWDKALERGMRLANPLLFSHSYLNSPASLCAIEFGLEGYHTTVCAGSQSGLQAVQMAAQAIALGHATIMVCGGVDAMTPARELCEPVLDAGEAAILLVLQAGDVNAGRNLDVNLLTTLPEIAVSSGLGAPASLLEWLHIKLEAGDRRP